MTTAHFVIGFLDGGDRTVVLSNHSPTDSPTPTAFDADTFSPLVSCAPSPTIATPVIGPPTPPIVTTSDHLGSGSALLVTNLPAALFSSDADLRPLFCPYGEVVNIRRLPNSPATAAEGNISVIVEYQSAEQAKEARDMLYGQTYANQPLSVDFLATAPSPRPVLDQWSATIADVKARLNPNAAPFLMHGNFSQDALSKTSDREQGFNIFDPPDVSRISSRLVTNTYQSNTPMMPRPMMFNSLCPPNAYVRPNSAPGRCVLIIPVVSTWLTIRS